MAFEGERALLFERIRELESKLDREMEAHAALQQRCFDYGNPTHSSIFDERDMLKSKLQAAIKDRDTSEQCLHALQEKFGTQSHELVTALDRLDKEIERRALTEHKLELAEGRLSIQEEYATKRMCSDHQGKWARGRCVLCELEKAEGRLDGLRTQVRGLLLGIDGLESDHEEGWWETSKGAEFGKHILDEIDKLFLVERREIK